MKKFKWQIILILAAIAAFFAWQYFDNVKIPGGQAATYGEDTVRAEVQQIVEEGTVDMNGKQQAYQVARVKILDGTYAGIPMEIDYGKRQVRFDDYRLKVGDQLIVSISKTPDNVLHAYFADFVRTTPLLILFAAFSLAILLISRWKGFRALVSMLFSLFVIIKYIIPHILAGEDPLLVSIIGSIVLLGVTLYLTYGWNLKSHAAVMGMFLALLLTGLLSAFFMVLVRINGTGDENAMFLMQMMNMQINLRGLYLGGVIIGALGVLDDLVMTQASAVFELHQANTTLGFRTIYNSAMRIGQDHVAATVNTLVLAYAGGSLPMFLMFSLARGNYAYLVNFSFIAEEVVRTLVGSLGLIAAVPLTTIFATGLALYGGRLGNLRQFLGSEGEAHSH